MQNKYFITAYALFLLLTFNVHSQQTTFQYTTSSTNSNFFAIKDDFSNWYSQQPNGDSTAIREAKRFYRFESFWRERVYNSSNITGSFTEYSKAAFKAMLYNNCDLPDNSDWKPIGPFPMGIHNMGFIRSVWNDPDDENFIIVGNGRNSGIYRSIDGGANWTDVLTPNKIPAIGITSFAVSPNKNNGKRVIYASVGGDKFSAFSVGILKSTDDGTTWTILENFPLYDYGNLGLLPYYSVLKVIVPKNLSTSQQDIVYAVAKDPNPNQGGWKLFKSINGGVSWTSYTFPTTTGAIVDFEINPDNYNKIFVSTERTNSNRAEVWFSADGGTSFTEVLCNSGYSALNSVGIVALSYPKNNRIYAHTAYGSTRKVMYSDNDGSTWTILSPNYNNSLSQFNVNSFVVNGLDSIYIGTEFFSKSNKKKANYTYGASSTTHGDIRFIQLVKSIGTNDIIITGNDGGVSKSYDGGNTWVSLNGFGSSGLMNSELQGFDISEFHPDRIIAGRQDNHTGIMLNGSWFPNSFLSGDGEECRFKPNDDSYFYSLNNCVITKNKINANGTLTQMQFSNDPGINCYSYGQPADTYLGRPIAISKSNSNRLYVGKKGHINITDNDGVSWQSVKLLDSDGITAIPVEVMDIEISESNPNYVYATTSYIMWSNNAPKNAVYLSTDYGQTWSDITSGITTSIPNYYMMVTDLTIDYTNPNKVWIGMSGVGTDQNGNSTQRVFKCENTSNPNLRNWEDITTNSITSLPVNAIVNQPGTDRVFIGTDGGIFYWENNDWHCFSENFPITWIKDLKINRQTSEIYAGTYGHGIWKSHLPCVESNQSYLIDNQSGNITWSTDKAVGGNIFITDGKTLTINNNAIISMGANKKIIVTPGARLIVDNATITSGCGTYWQGIEVWGTYNQSQVPHANGLSIYQGEIEVINGGTIQNALMAISAAKINADGNFDWTKMGGIVKLNGAILKNNNYDVWIGGYRNKMPSTGKVIANYGYIVNSTFTKDDNMLPGHDGYACVGLVDVGPLMIRGNKFKNLQTGLSTADRGYGIIGYDVSINMTDYCPSTGITHVNLSQSMASTSTPCTGAETNKFEGFYYGVNITNANGLPNSSININNAEFENVYHGIYLNATKYSVVTNCDFTIPSTDLEAGTDPNLYDAYGLYLDGCDGYRVEENHFDKGGDFQGIRGIVVNNTGGNNNELYKNYLANMGYSIQAQKNNRGNGTGLGLYCNEMNNDEGNDIVVLGQGIAAEQKILGTDPNNPYFAAGNIFTSCSGGSSKNFNNLSTGSILYYPDANNIPLCVNNVNITNSGYLTRSCPSKLSSSLSVSLSKVSVATVALNSATTILNIWKDGGNANLDNEVKTTEPWDVYVQFNNLISRSPFLSDQVLIETILNPAFNSLMIKLVMIANPQCTRNQEVMDALYNRDPQLPQSYIDEILAGEGTISQLELLEADVAACRHELDANANDAKRYYQMDLDEGVDVLSAYTSFLNSLNTFESKIDLAALYFSIDNYEAANSTLANIASNFELSEFQQTDLGYWQTYFTIARDVKEATCKQNVLSDTQISDLTSIADNLNSMVAPYALSLLKINNLNLGYVEPVEPVTENAPRVAGNGNAQTITSSEFSIKIYPNPANDYIVIDYKLDKPYNKLVLQITDPTGKIVLSQDLKGGQNEELINISTLKPGIYNASVKGDGKVMSTVKLTVLSK